MVWGSFQGGEREISLRPHEKVSPPRLWMKIGLECRLQGLSPIREELVLGELDVAVT